MDMSEKLWQVYSRLDPVSLNRVITEVRSGPPEQLVNRTRVLTNEAMVDPTPRRTILLLWGFSVLLFSSIPCPLKDLACFEKQWSCFFSSMDQESHLSILELSEAQAGEVGPDPSAPQHTFTCLLSLPFAPPPQVFRTYYTHGLSSSNIPEKR